MIFLDVEGEVNAGGRTWFSHTEYTEWRTFFLHTDGADGRRWRTREFTQQTEKSSLPLRRYNQHHQLRRYLSNLHQGNLQLVAKNLHHHW